MAYLEHNVSGQIQRVPLDPKAISYVVGDGSQLGITAADATHAPAASALAAFYRSKRHFVLLRLGLEPVLVNQCNVSLIKIIREGDLLAVGTHNVTFRELITEDLRNDSDLISARKRCLVDGTDFKAGDRVVFCPACPTAYHARCWEYQKGRCASRICDYQAPWDEPDQKTI